MFGYMSLCSFLKLQNQNAGLHDGSPYAGVVYGRHCVGRVWYDMIAVLLTSKYDFGESMQASNQYYIIQNDYCLLLD